MDISIIKNKIKEYIKLIYTCPRYKSILNNLKTDKKSKIILFGTPAHGNLGDQAIAISEMKFLHDIAGDRKVIEIPMPLYKTYRKQLCKCIREDDIIIISGGGWMGNLWIHNEITIREIVEDYSRNKIIIFPQTLYYTEDEQGLSTAEETKVIFDKHNNLILTVRDSRSFEYARKQLGFIPDRNLLFCPDMVVYGTLAMKSIIKPKEKNALLCLRNDIEKKNDSSSIVKILNDAGYITKETTTVLNNLIPMDKRDEAVKTKIKEFGEASIVVTDRLHAMLFALLAGTPCLAFDNTTGKVFGVGQYLKDNGMPVYLIDTICRSTIENIDKTKKEYCLNNNLKGYFQRLEIFVNKKEI
ncbi:MAG: polysaccharide pyruvyl transferase family protein [Lachnospiraceae bacterium]|nr:polysaccharide pyruvyl transferase family protein [Lachnospiraceae bacterium]